MINRGIIQKIIGNDIFVQVLKGEPTEDKGSCTSCSCASCGCGSVKTRLVQVVNPANLPIEPGSLIEVRLSLGKILLVLFRFLIIPFIFFITTYNLMVHVVDAKEGLSLSAGFIAFVIAFSLNCLVGRKGREMPEILRVL